MQCRTNYGGHNAILTIAREALLEEIKFLLQTQKSPLLPTLFSLTEDPDKKKKGNK